jgi:hypothetical protein
MASEINADKLAALEALLLKERERRASEEPITMIITGVPRGDDDAYPPGATVIITGVPDDDDEAPPIARAPEDFHAHRRVSEMLSSVDKPMPTTRPPAPIREASVKRPDEGPHRIIVQVRAPDPERGDHGEVAEGTYTVAGNVVRVEDTEGRSLGGQVLRPGDNPATVARAILRTTKAPEPFWAPINYH